jgi:hypothetical protein
MLVIAINRIAALRDDSNFLPCPNAVMNVFMFQLQVFFQGVFFQGLGLSSAGLRIGGLLLGRCHRPLRAAVKWFTQRRLFPADSETIRMDERESESAGADSGQAAKYPALMNVSVDPDGAGIRTRTD